MSGRSPVQATEEQRLARLPRRAGRSRPGAGDPQDAGGPADRRHRPQPWRERQHRARMAGLFLRGGVNALRYRPPSGGRPGTVGWRALAIAQEILA